MVLDFAPPTLAPCEHGRTIAKHIVCWAQLARRVVYKPPKRRHVTTEEGIEKQKRVEQAALRIPDRVEIVSRSQRIVQFHALKPATRGRPPCHQQATIPA